MEIFMAILQIVIGAAVLIPLVIALVMFIKKSIQEKNWQKLLPIAMELMAEAEKQFKDGAEKKEWVMAMLRKTAEEIEYPFDEEAIGNMIDGIIALTKQVNVKTSKKK